MTDRDQTVRDLAEDIADHDGVRDAWTAKSFTDRLLVVETAPEESVPTAARELLTAYGFAGADEVYDVDGATDAAFAGRFEDCRRYRFVDTESRGQHRSYVVE
ncbi:hypothetical protein ACFQL1_16815 [Halomicroarcula sp. GCM10025709]|uniref:hypothetical protein n=1 Tax=Haloarcula TaxID=2237 RepID=UPI0024C39B9E|nr:hypothetical protein [Halomicroarcula sp. YJ-61-S]